MRNITTLTFSVRSYEVGHNGTVLHGSIMNYLEEGAVQASNRAGYNDDWFEQHGYLWLVRKWFVHYLKPIYLNDILTLQTWISDFRRVQSHREYVLLRGDEMVVRARANWVFIHRDTMRPARLLSEFEVNYGPIPDEPLEPIRTKLAEVTSVQAVLYQFPYEVRYEEIDRAKHVNNAHYVRWVENNIMQILRSCGLNLLDIVIESHELEYHHSAQLGDTVLVQSQIVGFNSNRLSWQHKLLHSETQQTIAVAESITCLKHSMIDPILDHLCMN